MTFRTHLGRFACALVLFGAPATVVSERLARSGISSEHLLSDIRHLTSSKMEGRETGTQGLTRAAEYISQQFSRAGLQPMPGGSYLQYFPVTTGARLEPGNSFEWSWKGSRQKLTLNEEFEPYAFSASAAAEGPVVFAGYGITACEYGYDDYAGLDVRGRIVLILRHEPQEYDNNSPFEGRVYTEHSQLYRKLLNARAHGASGVLFVSDAATHSGTDTLERLSPLPSPGGAGLPFVGVRADVAERWFELSGRSFTQLISQIDSELTPASFAFPDDLQIRLDIRVKSTAVQAANVVGYLPGESPEYIVLGAHYDHLGNGAQFSLGQSKSGVLHPGADDNASGTAALLSLARWFGAQPRPKRGILFAAFAGEEIGLLGSTWFTQKPPFPLSGAVAMLNMDMIGRMQENTLTVGGTATGEGLAETVESCARRFPFRVQTGRDAVYGSSDHTAFTSHGVPVLFFFTGLHGDYHRPTDTADRIDSRNTALVADLVGSIAASLASAGSRPAFHFRAGSGCEAPPRASGTN